MLIGYVGVSTLDQHVSLQKDALQHSGYKHNFQDEASGAKSARSGLQKALYYAHTGDTPRG
ncbi:MAG: recombinase family protein [Ardenticatenaceae bacterium]|nr:recombinase family protein [Anaerolineales bacterium]MCB9005899.1 recombinase family protein [Ardenticatenaceae bacterium]